MAEKEYIEREALIEKISEIKPSGVFTEALKELVLIIISEQPAADVQEIVRCKECSYFAKNTNFCWVVGKAVNETSFCSNFNRKQST